MWYVSSIHKQFVPVVILPPFNSLALVCCPRTPQEEKFDGVELSSIQNPGKNEIFQS